MLNIETAVITFLKEHLDVPVSASVPASRPTEFVTVERVGGPEGDGLIDYPRIAIQAWSTSRSRAASLLSTVVSVMHDVTQVPGITKSIRSGFYNWPDLDTNTARYQATYEMTTNHTKGL